LPSKKKEQKSQFRSGDRGFFAPRKDDSNYTRRYYPLNGQSMIESHNIDYFYCYVRKKVCKENARFSGNLFIKNEMIIAYIY
jgi:hypothetical protein